MRRLLCLLSIAGLAAGCGDGRPDQEPAGPAGRTYVSEAVTDMGRPRPLVPGTAVRLTFHDDGRLTAAAGCNTLAGTGRVEGGVLESGELSTTEIGCDQARHDQDRWLAAFLASRPALATEGDRMTLTAGDTVVALVAVEGGRPGP